MARKKTKAKRPPLSGTDRFLYSAAEILLIALSLFSVLVFGIFLPQIVAKRLHPNLIASSGDFAALGALPLMILFIVTAIWIAVEGQENRQPIFGNKSFKKPLGTSFLPAYPLFSKEFRKNLTEKQKQKIKTTLFLWAGFLLLCILIYLPSLFSRTVFLPNRTMEFYNGFNMKTESYVWEELQEMEISVATRTKSRNRVVEVTLRYKNDSSEFSAGDFRCESREEVFRELIRLKESLPAEKVRVPTTRDIENLLQHNNYSETELDLILKLVDYHS